MRTFVLVLTMLVIFVIDALSLADLVNFGKLGVLYNCAFPVQGVTLDGEFSEPFWKDVPWHKVNHHMHLGWDVPEDNKDASFEFACAADKNYIYVGVKISDDKKVVDENLEDNVWNDDSIDIYIDGDNSKSSDYEKDVSQIAIGRYNIGRAPENPKLNPYMGPNEKGTPANKTGTKLAVVDTDYGWAVEVALPLETWDIELKDGNVVGFNIQLNDDDDKGTRDHKLTWSAEELSGYFDASFKNPSVFGELKLVEINSTDEMTNRD